MTVDEDKQGASDPWLKEQQASATKVGDARQDVLWERQALERLASSALNEQRRSRRWGIFFKMLTFAYLLVILLVYLPADFTSAEIKGEKHTAMVDVRGVIAADQPANASSIIKSLRNAFKNKQTAAVILRINSPGGSPVQAGQINDEIGRLKRLHPDVPVYAVIEDICASGGYYIAAAADSIYADKASMVGSIGVLMNGFGFVDVMKKVGIERRLLTAGNHKGFLDPFTPLAADDRRRVKVMLEQIHQQFIATVRKSRGDRLVKNNDELFSGLVWTGQQALELGLIDGLASMDGVAREIVHAERIVDFSQREAYLERLAERIGARVSSAFLGAQIGLR